MPKYAIQSALFSDAIHVGQLDKSGATFIDKEDCTNQVISAVIEYATRHHGGEISGHHKDGTKVTITIKKEAHND